MSSRIEKYREYYKSGLWKKDRIDLLYSRGLISKEEYDYILME